MSIYKGAVRTAGNEMEFLSAFATAFSGADSSISLTSSIPPAYSETNDGYSGKPFVEFTISGVYKIRVERPSTVTRSSSPVSTGAYAGKYALSSVNAVTGYIVTITHIPTSTTLTTISGNYGFRFAAGSSYATNNAIREWRYAVIRNAKTLVVQLSPYNRSLVDANPMADIVLITDNSTHVFRGRSSNGNSTSYSNDSGWLLDDQSTVTPVTRLSYYRDRTDENKISMIRNKVFKDASDAIVFTTDALMDRTRLGVVNRRIVINGQTYYVLDNNTIMPVS